MHSHYLQEQKPEHLILKTILPKLYLPHAFSESSALTQTHTNGQYCGIAGPIEAAKNILRFGRESLKATKVVQRDHSR